MMDGNKDDAARCVDIGEAAFRAGDFNKALKFLGKAQKLYPSKSVSSPYAADLLMQSRWKLVSSSVFSPH